MRSGSMLREPGPSGSRHLTFREGSDTDTVPGDDLQDVDFEALYRPCACRSIGEGRLGKVRPLVIRPNYTFL